MILTMEPGRGQFHALNLTHALSINTVTKLLKARSLRPYHNNTDEASERLCIWRSHLESFVYATGARTYLGAGMAAPVMRALEPPQRFRLERCRSAFCKMTQQPYDVG